MKIEQAIEIVEDVLCNAIITHKELEDEFIYGAFETIMQKVNKTGKRIDEGYKEEMYSTVYRCDNCKETMIGKTPYCPECGIKLT